MSTRTRTSPSSSQATARASERHAWPSGAHYCGLRVEGPHGIERISWAWHPGDTRMRMFHELGAAVLSDGPQTVEAARRTYRRCLEDGWSPCPSGLV